MIQRLFNKELLFSRLCSFQDFTEMKNGVKRKWLMNTIHAI